MKKILPKEISGAKIDLLYELKKLVDDEYWLWYIRLAMEVGLFFMPFFRCAFKAWKGVGKHKEFNGGGSCAHENNTGMYRMQES